ncbi:MAG: Tm-1-like ATP-binding domain-containing protein, partial [Roseimicrobium sp.]
MKTIAVLGTLDTKGEEHAYVAERIRVRGHDTLLVDVGCLTPPMIKPDVSRETVAEAGQIDLAGLVARKDRGESVAAMAHAASVYLA